MKLSKILLLTMLAAPVSGFAASPEAARVPLADPFIMLHEGVYYAYGTNSPDGIEVWTSDNLETWKKADGMAAGGLALHKDDAWGGRWFWAPEVYFLNGRFHMYLSIAERICVAVADSPLGPFVQKEKKPFIEEEQCIDNHLFIDSDGKAYMYFDRFNDGLNIWAVEMEVDYVTMKKETLRKCINVSQDWETVWPRVNEGCFVMKHNGRYYMTYSANSYESQNYGVGCAVADSPYGPWTKYDHNPLLQFPGDLVGVGHSAMYRDKAGNLKIVFHAHNDRENIHPRYMYTSDVYFLNEGGGSDVMWISPSYITARVGN